MKPEREEILLNLKAPLPPPLEGSPQRPFAVRFRENFRWRQAFTALHYPNYRLWFWGQMISLFGTWMQSTAQGFLIFELTHSPAYLGYAAFALGVPTWFFMMYGGVLADRIQRRTLLIITQTMMMVLAVILSVMSFLNVVQAWHIIILAFGLGIANAFDAPARQAFVRELVDREDMTNAIALNSTMFNSATAIGPAVSGVTYALVGPAWCFAINAVSFLAVIVALLLMKIGPQMKAAHKNSARDDLKEGMHYTLHHTMIRTLIAVVGITTFFGVSFATLIPAWAVKILGGDSTTNGIMQSARGLGALLGALMIASLGRFQFKGRLLTLGSFAFPVLLLTFGFVHWLPLSLLMLFGLGVSIMLIFNLANALVQTLVPDSLRGRVMSIYALAFFGLIPLGSLWVGLIAEHVSEAFAVIVNSIVLLGLFVLIRIIVPKLHELP
ncbi:MAG: MFS transporter [Candidatus Aminicenantes bacterium]|nr:MFS transporter [Candidatus Aminicenantes bacterium]